MRVNMGRTDRLIRAFVIAPLAIVLAFVVGASTIGGIILFVIAGIMLATAAVSTCPLYLPFGLSTCPTKTAKP